MKKLVLAFLALIIFLLPSCSPDYSYSQDVYNSQDVYDSDEEASRYYEAIADFNLFEESFVSEYYKSIGEDGLKRLADTGSVTSLFGRYGGILLCANTPDRMLFTYTAAKYIHYVMEYDKLTGNFSYACHDVLCNHDYCLFSLDNKILSSGDHLFFTSHVDSGSEYYVADLDGSNPKKLPITNGAQLHSDTEKGLYWKKTTHVDGKALYSLWLYDYSSHKSEQVVEPTANAIYHVIGDTVYLQDWKALKLYRFSEDFSQKTEVADDVTYLRNFGGSLYDYNGSTRVLRKLEGDKMVTVATLPSPVLDHWVSDGYIYYCCVDQAQIESYKDDDALYEYVSEYNKTCGNVYRIKEFGDTPELVYNGSHGGKPDRIDFVFADGEVLYIQYRSYRNFPNNFNEERGETNLVILDVTTGKSIDISNEKTP